MSRNLHGIRVPDPIRHELRDATYGMIADAELLGFRNCASHRSACSAIRCKQALPGGFREAGVNNRSTYAGNPSHLLCTPCDYESEMQSEGCCLNCTDGTIYI